MNNKQQQEHDRQAERLMAATGHPPPPLYVISQAQPDTPKGDCRTCNHKRVNSRAAPCCDCRCDPKTNRFTKYEAAT